MRTTASLIAAVGLAVMGGLAACGGNGSTKSAGLSVSVRSAAGTPTPAGLSVSQGVTISRVRMAVRRISVEGGDATAACEPAPITTTTPAPLQAMKDGGSGGDGDRPDDGAERGDDDECEFAFGPFDVDLSGSALSGGVAFAFSAPIPAGTFEEVSISVNTVSAARAGTNPVLLDLAAAHASILVDGFVQDVGTTATHPFTFSTPMEVTQKREGAIVIGPSSNVTLTFDPSGWFLSGGSRLDPTDPANQGVILANIRASLRLVHDDDHDGRDDDEEHGSGHR